MMIMSMLIIIIVISRVMTDDNKAVITIQDDNFHPTTIKVSPVWMWCIVGHVQLVDYDDNDLIQTTKNYGDDLNEGHLISAQGRSLIVMSLMIMIMSMLIIIIIIIVVISMKVIW